MGLPAHEPVFTADDYLAWESAQPERHDFLDGEVFAMAGVSPSKRVLDPKYLKCKVEVIDACDTSEDPIHEEIRKELYTPLSVKIPVIQFDVAGELASLREENRKLLDTLANYDMAVSELEFRLETLRSQHDTLLREFFHETAAMSMTCSKPN